MWSGLTYASTIIQQTLKILHYEFNWRTCLSYLGDLIILLKLFDIHVQDEGKVLSTLQKASVSLNLGTCCFFVNGVEYMGNFIHPGAQIIHKPRIKRFDQLHHYWDVIRRQFLLELCSSFWGFVPSYTDIVTSNDNFLPKAQSKGFLVFDK